MSIILRLKNLVKALYSIKYCYTFELKWWLGSHSQNQTLPILTVKISLSPKSCRVSQETTTRERQRNGRAYGNSQHDKWQSQFRLHSHHLQTLENYHYFLLFIYQPIFTAITGSIINRLASSVCLNLSSKDEKETRPV